MDRVASAWTRAAGRRGARSSRSRRSISGRSRARSATSEPLWKYSWPNGEQRIRLAGDRRGRAVHDDSVAPRRLCRRDPALVLLHARSASIGPEWSASSSGRRASAPFAAILGVVIGVWMYSPSKRYRYAGAPTSIPYRGQKRWHTVLGLIFGVAAATWAFSGMLSMDPFPSRDGRSGAAARASKRPDIAQALRGRVRHGGFRRQAPAARRWSSSRDVRSRSWSFTSFAGEPMYMATLAPAETRGSYRSRASRSTAIDRQRIIDVVKKAAPEPERRRNARRSTSTTATISIASGGGPCR